MEWVSPLAIRRAFLVVEICKAISFRANQYILAGDTESEDWKRILGELAPLLGAAANDLVAAEPAMDLLKTLIQKDVVLTTYDNHKPQRVLSEAMAF